MKGLLIRLAHCRAAGSAAEFAMVLPLLLIFLLGIIDVGHMMWTWNRAGKSNANGRALRDCYRHDS